MRWMMIFSIFFLGFSNQIKASSDLTWTSDVLISSVSGLKFSPQVVVDSQGNAVATWTNASNTYLSCSLAGTGIWQTPVTISTSPYYVPSIAINASGHGVIAYDSGSANSAVKYNTFTVSSSGLVLSSVSSNSITATSFAPLAVIDNNGNMYITVYTNISLNGIFIYYIPSGQTAFPTAIAVNNGVYTTPGLNPYSLAINGAGDCLLCVNDSGSGTWTNFFVGGIVKNSGAYAQVYQGLNPPYPNVNYGIPAVLCGVGALGNAVTLQNIGAPTYNTTATYVSGPPYIWEILFSPAQNFISNPIVWNQSNMQFATQSVPVLSLNSNGLGVVAYDNPNNSTLYALFFYTSKATVGRATAIGQGTKPSIGTDENGNAFAVWIDPTGYLKGAWLPMGTSTWKSNAIISNQLVASGTSPSLDTTDIGQGVIVYATSNGIYSVFFSAETSSNAMLNASKNSRYHFQKGL